MNTNTLFAKLLGAVLTFIGLLGFFMHPVLGIFSVNTLHNTVHVLTGILGLVFGFALDGAHAKLFNRTFGIVYALVAILGFVLPSFMSSLLAIDTADNWLHVLIAVVTLGVGFGAKE